MRERFQLTRNSVLRISDKNTIQLIKELKKEECMWNTNLPDYPNKDERAAAAQRIAEKLNLPLFGPEHVMVKYKNLRNSYCQELKRMARNPSYRPKVCWFSIMDNFLRPHLQKINAYMSKNKITLNKTVPQCDVKTEILIDSDDQEFMEDWAIDCQSETSCSNSIQIDSSYSVKGRHENEEPSNQPQAKKIKVSDVQQPTEENGNVNENVKDKEPTTFEKNGPNLAREKDSNQVVSNKPDFCDTFGVYIASLLRTLPKKKALMVQPKIVALVVGVGLDDNEEEPDS